MADEPQISSDQSVAIVLLSIDQELAAKVMRGFPDDQVDSITRAMRELSEMTIDKGTVTKVYRDMIIRMRRGGMALGDVGEAMESMLKKAFGESRGQDVTAKAGNEILARRPFAMFESLTGEDLATLLTEEHPQIAAVFLAHLDRAKAGEALSFIKEDSRADLVRRVATLDRTPPDVVQRVLDVMRKKVKDLGLTTLRSEPKAWIKAAAEILNFLGGGEKSILDQIGERDEEVAGFIRDEMFTFDDIAKLDKKSMQKILGQVDTRVLALAMKAATPGCEENVFGNLSKRAADMVAEERDTLGPTPLSDVTEAQQQILVMIRDLMDKGEIVVSSGGEQLV